MQLWTIFVNIYGLIVYFTSLVLCQVKLLLSNSHHGSETSLPQKYISSKYRPLDVISQNYRADIIKAQQSSKDF